MAVCRPGVIAPIDPVREGDDMINLVTGRPASVVAAVGVLAASVLVGGQPAFAATDTFDFWYVARTTRHLMVVADSGVAKDTGQVSPRTPAR